MSKHPEENTEKLKTTKTENPYIESEDKKQTEEDSKDKSELERSVKDIPFEIFTGYNKDGNILTKEDIQEIAERFTALEQQIVQLSTEFQSKLKYDTHKDKIIDNLHAELQSYKNGVLEKLLRPVFMDVIEVIDDIRRLIKDLKSKDEVDNSEKLKKFFEAVPEDLEDLLYKHGVEVVQSKSTLFDPGVQKVVKVMPTEEASLDKSICERLKNGYTWEGKLLRHEVVNVWQFQKPL